MNDETKHLLNGRNGNRNKAAPSSRLSELCICAPEETLRRLESARSGLTEEEVEARREQYGFNEVTHERPATWYQQLFHAYLS
jgi:P-type Mg2+ transporter